MKIQLQLLVEHTLRDRLMNIKIQKGIPMSKTIADVCESHLHEFETSHGIQPQLPHGPERKEQV